MNQLLIKNIILNSKMATVYINEFNNINLLKYGIECIYPLSTNKDLHNCFKTYEYIRVIKSNYKYIDKNDMKIYKNWIKLHDNNYIIDKNNLIKWDINNPPDNNEILHNKIVSEYQGYENKYISNYKNQDNYKIF